MILGLSLPAFTLLHVIISVIAIGAGLVTVFAMWSAKRPRRWTGLFLVMTFLTCATGFLFPFTKVLPSHVTGVICLAVLAVALYALYSRELGGAWRLIYVVTATIALYLNVFVLVVQGFLKVPALQQLAPTQTEPAFVVAHALVLALFVAFGVVAARRFHPAAPLAVPRLDPMRIWARRTLIGVLAFLAIAAVAYYWLIVESHVPADLTYRIDLAEVRRLANEAAGDKPAAIEVEEVAAFEFPVARMQQAISHATQIVITHEHMDHIGGLAAQPDLAKLLPALRLTREQLDHPEVSLPARFPEHALDNYQPIHYERYLALAPGVVLIAAHGHTPGSQMVFVRTADGREVLLIGDVAWQSRNIETQRERARLVTWLMLKEDRHAVFGELAELKRISEQEPQVHIVPGHDAERMTALISGGILEPRFSEASPSS